MSINIHVYASKSTARAVIALARLLNTLNDKLNYKKSKTDRKNALSGEVIIFCLYVIRYQKLLLPLCQRFNS